MNEQKRETNISSLSKRLVVNVRFDNIEIPPVQVSRSCEESSSEEGSSEEPTAGVSEARTTENVPQRKHALRCQRSVAQ